MKGISKLADFFLKSMEIIFITLAILVAYFDLADFNFAMNNTRTLRETRLIGEALMSCKDLTVLSSDGYPIKALFDKSSLISYSNHDIPDCITYPKRIRMDIESIGVSIGDAPDDAAYVEFPVAIKENAGKVTPTTMKVYVV